MIRENENMGASRTVLLYRFHGMQGAIQIIVATNGSINYGIIWPSRRRHNLSIFNILSYLTLSRERGNASNWIKQSWI